MRKWYVIRTEIHAEHLAESQLSKDGYEVFVPRVNSVANPDRLLSVPLFSGYIFVRLDLDKLGWPKFKPYHRVIGLVLFGDEVPAISDSGIEELRTQVLNLNSKHGIRHKFSVGDHVRVVSGAIESIAEILEESNSPNGHVKVLLEFMGGLIPAKVPWRNLEPSQSAIPDSHKQGRRTRGKGRWIEGFGSRTMAKI